MGNIRVLPPLLRDQIAAGEVCERPASVVKELVENALDAGAENISVWVENGGIVSIRVADDGCGMEPEDAVLCFARHATSKLAENNLDGIFTMGFRGEALAAISAVSKITLITRTRGSIEGTQAESEGGTLLSTTPTGCPEGTNISVKDLFYNTPARLKFMKRDVSEAGMAESVVEKAAFAHPEVSFRMYRDGKETLHTPGDGNLLSTIYCVYGREYATKLLPVKNEYNGVIVKGYVSQPTAGRGNRSMQYFSVNGRPIRSRMLSAALDEAYKNAMPYGRYAFCFLDISLPYELVDVNVHPQKSEVRFLNERNVFDAVYFGVKNLWVSSKIQNISESENELPEEEIPLQAAVENRSEKIHKENSPMTLPRKTADNGSSRDAFPSFAGSGMSPVMEKPFENRTRYTEVLKSPGKPVFAEVPEIENEARNIETESLLTRDERTVPAEPEKKLEDEETGQTSFIDSKPGYRFCCEVFHTYIIAEGKDEIYIIDKHAAHERMIYEELLKHEGEAESQMLLTPYVCRLPREDYALLLASFDELDKAGFELEDFGSNSFLVRRVPLCLAGGDIPGALAEISQAIAEGKHDKRLSVRERLLYSVACRSAIKGGDYNTKEELDMICERVLDFEDIRFCPHGRPCAFKMNKNELEKRFGRLGV